MGAPDIRKPWTAEDFAAFDTILGKALQEDSKKYPQFKSEKSGQYFDHIIDLNNFDCIEKSNVSPEQKYYSCQATYDGFRLIYNRYDAAAQKGSSELSEEIPELMCTLLHGVVRVEEMFSKYTENMTKEEMANRGYSTDMYARMYSMYIMMCLNTAVHDDFLELKQSLRVLTCVQSYMPRMATRINVMRKLTMILNISNLKSETTNKDKLLIIDNILEILDQNTQKKKRD